MNGAIESELKNNEEYAIVSSITVAKAVIKPISASLRNRFVGVVFNFWIFVLSVFWGFLTKISKLIVKARRRINDTEMYL